MERKYYLRGLGVGIAVTAIIMGIALSGSQPMTDNEIIARARELGMVENTVLADPDDEETGEENADIQDETERTDAAAVNGQDHEDEAAPVSGAEDRETEAEPEDNSQVGAPAAAKDNSQTEAPAAAKDNSQAEAPAAAKDNSQAEAPADTKDNGQTEVSADTNDNDEADTAENANEIITSAAVKTITVNHGDGSYTVAKKLEDVGVVMSAATFDTFLCQNGYDKRLRTGTFSIPADASDEQIARIVTGAE